MAPGSKLNTLIEVVVSNSLAKISARPFKPNFETEYAPQKALPILATPEEVKIILGMGEFSRIGFSVFVRRKGALRFMFNTSSHFDNS